MYWVILHLLTKVGCLELLVFLKGVPQFSLLIYKIFVLGLCGSGLPSGVDCYPLFRQGGGLHRRYGLWMWFFLPFSLAVSWCWSLLLGVICLVSSPSLLLRTLSGRMISWLSPTSFLGRRLDAFSWAGGLHVQRSAYGFPPVPPSFTNR